MGTNKTRGRKPSVRTKVHHITMQHMQKENRRKPSVFAGFLAGAEGLEPSARGFGVDVGKRTRERGRTRCSPIFLSKSRKSGAGLVLREKSEAKMGRKTALGHLKICG